MSDAKNLVTVIIDTLDNLPERWSITEHWAKRDDGLTLYIGKGELLKISLPVSVTPGFFERRSLKKAITRYKINKLSMLNNEFHVKRAVRITRSLND